MEIEHLILEKGEIMKIINSIVLFLFLLLITGCTHYSPVPPQAQYENLIVTDTIYVDTPHVHSVATITHTVPVINTWYNITWNTTDSHAHGNISFLKNNQTITIQEEGEYKIIYGVAVKDTAPAPNAVVAFRVLKNNNQLEDSYFQTYTSKQDSDFWIEHFTYATNLSSGDNLTMQYISSENTVQIATAGEYSDQIPHTAYSYIERMFTYENE